MSKRAVLYARVSGDARGREGRSLAGQLEMCHEYAHKRGYIIVAELAEDDRGAIRSRRISRYDRGQFDEACARQRL